MWTTVGIDYIFDEVTAVGLRSNLTRVNYKYKYAVRLPQHFFTGVINNYVNNSDYYYKWGRNKNVVWDKNVIDCNDDRFMEAFMIEIEEKKSLIIAVVHGCHKYYAVNTRK